MLAEVHALLMAVAGEAESAERRCKAIKDDIRLIAGKMSIKKGKNK